MIHNPYIFAVGPMNPPNPYPHADPAVPANGEAVNGRDPTAQMILAQQQRPQMQQQQQSATAPIFPTLPYSSFHPQAAAYGSQMAYTDYAHQHQHQHQHQQYLRAPQLQYERQQVQRQHQHPMMGPSVYIIQPYQAPSGMHGFFPPTSMGNVPYQHLAPSMFDDPIAMRTMSMASLPLPTLQMQQLSPSQPKQAPDGVGSSSSRISVASASGNAVHPFGDVDAAASLAEDDEDSSDQKQRAATPKQQRKDKKCTNNVDSPSRKKELYTAPKAAKSPSTASRSSPPPEKTQAEEERETHNSTPSSESATIPRTSKQPVLMRKKRHRVDLPSSYTPSDLSVVIGKGRTVACMQGNIRLGELVSTYLPLYTKCANKTDRTNVVSEILQIMYEDCPVGAFVRKEEGRWCEVGDAVARIKIGAMLRDRLPGKYKSSTSVRVAIRRAKHALAAGPDTKILKSEEAWRNFEISTRLRSAADSDDDEEEIATV